MSEQKPSLTYRDAGVDIDAGNELVNRIKDTAARTRRPEVLGGLGGFGARHGHRVHSSRRRAGTERAGPVRRRDRAVTECDGTGCRRVGVGSDAHARSQVKVSVVVRFDAPTIRQLTRQEPRQERLAVSDAPDTRARLPSHRHATDVVSARSEPRGERAVLLGAGQ